MALRKPRQTLIKEEAEKLGVTLDFSCEITPGDLYLAVRNGPVHLLTCESVNLKKKWIVPTTNNYYYDTWECVKVIS